MIEPAMNESQHDQPSLSRAIRQRRNSLPPPPLGDAPRDLVPGDAIAHEAHGHAQALRVPVPDLVVKEEELAVRQAGALVQRLHVAQLGAGVDLEPGVEVVDGLAGLSPRARRRRLLLAAAAGAVVVLLRGGLRGRVHVQQLEHLPRQVGRARAARDADADAQVREAVQHRRHVRVEGVVLADFIGDGGVVGPGHGLEAGPAHVGVDPEGPEGVVEVEDEELGEGPAVGQDGREVGREECRGRGEVGGRGGYRVEGGGLGELLGHRVVWLGAGWLDGWPAAERSW